MISSSTPPCSRRFGATRVAPANTDQPNSRESPLDCGSRNLLTDLSQIRAASGSPGQADPSTIGQRHVSAFPRKSFVRTFTSRFCGETFCQALSGSHSRDVFLTGTMHGKLRVDVLSTRSERNLYADG